MSADSAALRVAIVGPAHPYKGGIAVHTTELARQMSEAGHEVDLISWRRLYPALLYPGQSEVAGEPEVPLYTPTRRVLSWNRPDSWVRVGRRLAAYDLVLIVHVVPQIVPAHLALLAAATRGERVPRLVGVVHNVLPHESRPGDEPLVRALFQRLDAVIVHTPEQANLAESLGAPLVRTVPLPPHLPGGPPLPREPYAGPARLLALGMVRPYKGIADLIGALARVPGPTLTVAGEAWGSAGEEVTRAAADAALAGRVDLRLGYVPAAQIPALLAEHDVLALTYRTATASQNALLAYEHGLAVLATRVGSFGADVRDGVDGLLVPPGDQEALVAALQRLADPAEVARLRGGSTPPDLSGPWARYVGALEALAAGGATPRQRSRITLTDRLKGLAAGWRPRLELSAGELPEWVAPTDVLGLAEEAENARDLARELGLPRGGSAEAQWAALGALAAILRLRDDGRRTALVVDQSGSDSPFAAWSRAIGFAPVELRPGAELDVDAESIDVLTRLHPGDVEPDELLDLLGRATWALRPGGILVVTLALGPPGMPGVFAAADLRAILAQADNAGLRLVGDLDGELTARMRRAAEHAGDPQAAYGVTRLTWRRR